MHQIVFKALVWKRLLFLQYYWVRIVLKAMVQKQAPNNHFLRSVWKSNCPEVHCGTNQMVSISFPVHGSIKLVIINMTYTYLYVKLSTKLISASS